MVRTTDLTEHQAQMIRETTSLEAFDFKPWTNPPPRRDRRVALVTTGAFHRREDRAFRFGAYDWRAIPSDERDIVTSHVSLSMDRTGFGQDINVAFPADRLEEAARDGAIGSIATTHFSFNGGAASDGVEQYQKGAKEVAEQLKQDGVNTVVLCPI